MHIVIGRVGGQSFLYFGLHSDYVSECNLVKGTIKFSFISYSNLFYCEKDENISHLFLSEYNIWYIFLYVASVVIFINIVHA